MTAKELIDIIKKDRHKRLTRHPVEPSAGCIFKNISMDGSNNLEISLKDRMPVLPELIVHNKLPVGTLIDKMGLKGTEMGGATISELHGNYIVNRGKAKSADVISLVNLVKEKVKEKIDIELEPEVLFIDEEAKVPVH